MMEQGDTTLSFDIFDTVLTRVWFKPVDLFTAVGRELAIEGLVADASSWAEAREVVESELRRALAHTEGGGSEEVSLIAVHNALAIRLGINQESHERALKIELDLERGAMRSIAATRAVIAAAQDAGQTVIFLSDTYFEQDFIIDILYRTGVKPAPNTVYTSLALGYTKRTGSLFSHVLAERGIAPSTLHHVGDNLHSDVVSPRKLGIESRHFVMQKPTRYEKHYYAVSFATPRLLRAAVAGAARTARLGSHESNRHRQVIAETSADVAGPMLTGFVLWVLVEAKRRGRTRLYFLARDGQILLQIAKRLTAWLGWDMELRYLYASRQALFLPSITALDEATLGWLTEKAADVTLAAILSRVEFDPHAETVLLIEAGFPPENWDRPLGSDGVKRLEQLLQQPSFVARIIAQASARRAVLLDYLTDEGMIDGVPFAIVDIGWKGRLQLCLGKILASRPGGNQTPLMGFYFGLVRRPDPRIAGELFTYVNTRLPHSALLETFVKADHGTVRGFCRSLPTKRCLN